MVERQGEGRKKQSRRGPGEGQHELDDNLHMGVTVVEKQLGLGKQILGGQSHRGKRPGRAEP